MQVQATFELTSEGGFRSRPLRHQLSLLHESCHRASTLFAYCSANTKSNSFFSAFEPCMFTSMLLAYIYEQFVLPRTNSRRFAWPLDTLTSTLEKIKALIRTYQQEPRNYNEAAIDAVLNDYLRTQPLVYPLPSRFGFLITGSVFVRVDLVIRRNSLFIPVLVITDTFKRQRDKTISQQLRDHAIQHGDWVGRIDDHDDLVYNTRHPTYLRILLAMAAIKAPRGLVIHYEATTQHFTEFEVAHNFTDIRLINTRALFCFDLFADILSNNTNFPIPHLTARSNAFTLYLREAEHDEDDTVVLDEHAPNVEFPWTRAPYTAIHQPPVTQQQPAQLNIEDVLITE